MTRRMNQLFALHQFEDAVCVAFQLTAGSTDELRQVFHRYGVLVKHLDHEVFGIYCGQIEPSYDVHVEGETSDVLAAAKEFGKRHAQEMVLIARKMKKNENDPSERMGLTIQLNEEIRIEVAVEIAGMVRACGFQGATFAPKKNGTISIYHTDTLGTTAEQFKKAAKMLVMQLEKRYTGLVQNMDSYFILMPEL